MLTGGAEAPRDLPVPGRDLAGIHFAMEFLPQQNRVVAGDKVHGQILATGKHVVVIGGGDTGSDCVGTSNRQRREVDHAVRAPAAAAGAGGQAARLAVLADQAPHVVVASGRLRSATGRSRPSASRAANGRVEKLVAVRVEWRKDASGAMKMVEVPGTEFEMKADLVLLAMGFLGPVQAGLLEQLGVERDPRSNVRADTEDYQTSVPKVFAAGDMRRGQSLVVWAIREGRQCARAVDLFLMGSTELPR